jgi:hypothetical protein
MAGAVLLSLQGEALRMDSGALLVAGACLAWGLDNNFTRKISAADPVSIAMIKGLIAGTVSLGLATFGGLSMPTIETAVLAGVVGFFGICFAPSRNRANRSLLFDGTIHWRGYSGGLSWRASNYSFYTRRNPHGGRYLASPFRTP